MSSLILFAIGFYVEASSIIECPPLPALSDDTRSLLALSIRSPIYIERARNGVMSPDLFNLLASRYVSGFEGVERSPSNEETVVILEGRYLSETTTLPTLPASSVGDEIRQLEEPTQVLGDQRLPPIPETDVIRTDLGDRLRELVAKYWEHVAASAIAEEKEGEFFAQADPKLDEFNVDLYSILVQGEQMSVGNEMQCVLWRTVLRQIHYRLLISVADTRMLDVSLLDVLTSMSIVAKNTDGLLKKSFAPLLILAAPYIAQGVAAIGCWCLGQCIQWYRRTTTTSTTQAPSTEDPLIQIRKEQRLGFFSSANQYLDIVGSAVRVFSCKDQEEFVTGIAPVRNLALEKLSSVAAVVGQISAISSGFFDASDLTKHVLTVISSLSSVSNFQDWPGVQEYVLSSLGEIRSQLFDFALSTQ